MKMKQLLAAALLLCSVGAWAQTDVTSTYLTNPSFEYSASGTASSAQALTNGGTYYGWTLPNLGASYVNISIGNSSACNGQAFGIPTAKEGTYYYYERRGWNNNSSADATLSTTLSNLPVGHYELTMAYKGLDSWDDSHNSKGSYLKIEAVEGETLGSVQTATFDAVKGNSAGANRFTGDANWNSVSLTFDVATAGNVTLNIIHHFVGGVRTDAVIDNLTLTYTDPNAAANAAKLEAAKYSLNGYIKKATALNGVLDNATLTAAIGTAQGVYDAATDYTTHYDGVVSAATTLNANISTALSGATAVALTNGNFDTTPNNTLDGNNTVFGGTLSTATANPDNTKDLPTANTGDHGYLYEVTGWTQYSKFNSTASQGTTSEYGTAMPANGWSTNGTTIPATDMFGASTGAALHLSAGWNDQARYQQTIENLPSGRYVMYYEVINQHSNTGIASNYIGVNGAAGDFYGTSNAFVYSGLNSIEQGVWKAQAFEFDVAKTANINFSVGVTTSTGGSANGAKLWIDNVLVYRVADVVVTAADADAILAEVDALDAAVYNATDKSALATAKSTFESNKSIENYNALNAALIAAQASVAVYTALDAAITKVENWTATTAAEGIRAKYTNGEYTDETAADIYAAYQVAEIAALTAASATDFTSVILNQSFETGDMTGWSAESRSDTGVKENSNGTYTINNDVDGNYIFNSWGGSAENNVYQTIKNLPAGTYQLSALLAGFTGEELVLAANEVTNSVTVAGDKTTGYTVNVVFTLSAAADVIIKASNTKATSADASFIKADNFRLAAYSDPLAPLKEQLSALKTTATNTLDNSDYDNVTGEEKTTLTAKAAVTPEETEAAYSSAISELTAAISAFTAAKPAYDAYAEIRGIAVALGVTPGDAPANAAAAPDATHALNVAVYNATTAANIFDVTDVYVPSWSDMSTSSSQHWSGDTSKSYADNWSGSTNTTERSATVTLPAGEFILMSAGRGSANTLTTMSANGTTVTFASNGDMGLGINKNGAASFDADDTAGFANKSGAAENSGTGWEWRYIPVTLSAETDVTVIQKLTRLSGGAWGSFSDFRILKKGEVAGATDYAALNDAISAAEAKTLGFEDGQYAPYENVAALEALTAAKSIDQTVPNEKETVEAVTASLTSAIWSANDGDVDAIYNGTFAETGTGSNPKGWTRSNNGWGQQITGLTAEANDVAEGTTTAWYYNNNGAWQYGNDGVYTMPLAANQMYELSFKYSKHGGDWQSWMKASVVNSDDEGLEVVQFAAADNSTNYVTAKAYFTTGAAGNYILSIEQNGNAHLTDVSLVKTTSVTLALNEGTAYKAKDRVYYETVTVARTVKAGFNTVCMPFDMTAEQVANAFGDQAKVYTFEDVPNGTNSTINFNTKAGNTIEANVPVLIGDATATTEAKTFNHVMFKSGEAKVEGTNFDFVGVYAPIDPIPAGNYFVGEGALHKSTGATSLNAFRAYIQDKTNGSGDVKMFIDGLATGIEAIDNGQLTMDKDSVFNLAGQRLNKAQKGVNIVNGKKVLVK